MDNPATFYSNLENYNRTKKSRQFEKLFKTMSLMYASKFINALDIDFVPNKGR